MKAENIISISWFQWTYIICVFWILKIVKKVWRRETFWSIPCNKIIGTSKDCMLVYNLLHFYWVTFLLVTFLPKLGFFSCTFSCILFRYLFLIVRISNPRLALQVLEKASIIKIIPSRTLKRSTISFCASVISTKKLMKLSKTKW